VAQGIPVKAQRRIRWECQLRVGRKPVCQTGSEFIVPPQKVNDQIKSVLGVSVMKTLMQVPLASLNWRKAYADGARTEGRFRHLACPKSTYRPPSLQARTLSSLAHRPPLVCGRCAQQVWCAHPPVVVRTLLHGPLCAQTGRVQSVALLAHPACTGSQPTLPARTCISCSRPWHSDARAPLPARACRYSSYTSSYWLRNRACGAPNPPIGRLRASRR
jgi:hypothetical protein